VLTNRASRPALRARYEHVRSAVADDTAATGWPRWRRGRQGSTNESRQPAAFTCRRGCSTGLGTSVQDRRAACLSVPCWPRYVTRSWLRTPCTRPSPRATWFRTPELEIALGARIQACVLVLALTLGLVVAVLLAVLCRTVGDRSKEVVERGRWSERMLVAVDEVERMHPWRSKDHHRSDPEGPGLTIVAFV
jgi:hypothetical protein